jgi:ComF family protein
VGSINFICGNSCPRCGHPHWDDNRGESDCWNCRGREFAFRSCRSLFEYNGLGRAIVREIKYRGSLFLLPDVGRLSRELFGDLRGKVLVPVPLHWRRRLLRGYNQSELICSALASEHGCRTLRLLRRVKPTRQQVGLGRVQRLENMVSAFAVDGHVVRKKKIARDEEIFLVDDVLTTGSTMHACAVALAGAGFRSVQALSLARG